MQRMAKVLGAVLITTIGVAGAGSVLAETRTVPHGDAVIEYHIDGKGPLVLMIPSLGRPASDFDDLAARLSAAGYTTVRPEPRGIGRSSGPMKDVTLRDLAADVLASVPTDSGPIIVIGHAFGQRVARMLATQYPDRVKTVIMLAAGGKVPQRPGGYEAALAVFDPKLSPDKHLEAVRFAFFAPGNDPAVWRDGWYPAVAEMQLAAFAEKVEEWWGAGKASMLVVQGLQDILAPPENGRMIKDEYGERTTLQEIDGAGHAMLPERPIEIAAAVMEFLDQYKGK
jgi:pimeloyl-ACP methyl ester carboxylesterase